MKLEGNLPPRHDTLLFSISGMGSFICPVAQTRLGIYTKAFIYPVMDHWGESRSAPARGRVEPPTRRSTVEHANHQTRMTIPSRKINWAKVREYGKLDPKQYQMWVLTPHINLVPMHGSESDSSCQHRYHGIHRFFNST